MRGSFAARLSYNGDRPSLHVGRCDPSTLVRRGGRVILASASLYDTDRLADRLGIARDAPPAGMILSAFEEWHDRCVDNIEGDFAFAIWDQAREQLFCARDRFGVRPLLYAWDDGALAISDNPPGLRSMRRSHSEPDELAIAAFLAGRSLGDDADFETGVDALPPAQSMIVTGHGCRLRHYWTLHPDPASPQREPSAEFRDLLTRSVERRVRNTQRPASLLSGGLDSTSVSCIAAQIGHPAHSAGWPSYSSMFSPEERGSDAPYIQAAIDSGAFQPTVLKPSSFDPLAGIERAMAVQGGPVLAPNLAFLAPLLSTAKADGVDVMLDGHGGDEVVSHGFGRLDELAGAGHWLRLWRESGPVAAMYHRSTSELVSAVAARTPGRAARIVERMLPKKATDGRGRGPAAWIDRDLLQRTRLGERLADEALYPPGSPEARQHLATVTGRLQGRAFAVLDRMYGAHGIEGRFPFWDRELVRFCVALPAKDKLGEGFSRLILRRGMAGVIPDAVRLRTDKMDFTGHLARGMAQTNARRIDALLQPGGALAPFIDIARAREDFDALKRSPESQPSGVVQAIWRIAALGIWLEMQRAPRTEGVAA